MLHLSWETGFAHADGCCSAFANNGQAINTMAEVQYQRHKADPAFRAATAKLGDVELDAVSEAAVNAACSLKVNTLSGSDDHTSQQRGSIVSSVSSCLSVCDAMVMLSRQR